MMGSELHEVYNYVLDMLGLYALDIPYVFVLLKVVREWENHIFRMFWSLFLSLSLAAN